jgi:hypothetical protein
MLFILKILIASTVISFVSWLSGRLPILAGFIIALPLQTMIVLPLSRLEHRDPAKTLTLAKSILLAVPVSMLFLLPFVFAETCGLSFWQSYGIACALLLLGFGVHHIIAHLV